jgi:hypothetical protein
MRKILIIGLALALATFACEEPDPPKPHESTITAFGKTAKVIGDASISTADFNTAKGKLEEAMVILATAASPSPDTFGRFTNMLDRLGFTIIIGTGDAAPDADANKSMTIGVDYLLNNDAETTIVQTIVKIVYTNNAFAD